MPRNTAKEKELINESHSLLNDTEALLAEAAQVGVEKAQGIYERIAQNLINAKGHLLKAESDLTEKAKQAAKTTDRYVQEHPWQSIGVAAAVGALLGMLIGRK
jgi:ElaB/YqjD/DUF883 family membrane-anchored ribosome-binding protein